MADRSIDEIQESQHPNTLSGDSTESSVRYAAYANRLRTILLASHRYVAYTSDIGESFRPAVSPLLVKACYGISWTYVLGDVSYESWKAKLRQEGRYVPGLKPWDPLPPASEEAKAAAADNLDWKLVGLKRGLFQSIASMGLPAFTIHTAVKQATKYAEKNIKNQVLRTWGPIGLGLSIVPALPYLFDEPVEHIMDKVFDELHLYLKDNKKKLD
ncbi:CYFA0S02e01332g1_1 [Cyberlindnera fabianii]|uniref:Mitochondrial fission process protein 1 n=1 Tax=Cyberlindnera fabianii TaxID=36022 RepID=A0A061AST0_CYBFA|nr:Mitochondrial fission process protein 1 [Cyberlindnera fabianii]CDR38407.1 CYFA0S02e01332g1_1 [Cyberlindnera fabianii]